ncbi:glycosyltransferase family 4 protein [Aquibium sp. ELW1220]|uniref:glycosyltransferase family 4 protein n=1 Tax=Aquibium sp. ELW1220 TaxID=2976766 RepID=UPI0025B24463|nr:glycosyltransferase family 4 protein [Aquibium sp. ELW1220]MDN2578975.1 glycosyltransferase family 4 protein [Aquibium sp. ELW1220]
MAGLAEALAWSGRRVTYVAEQPMSEDRAKQGWTPARADAMTLRLAPDAAAAASLVAGAPEDSIHICQGFRGNGVVGPARIALDARGLRQWVIMETVEERGWAATMLKRLEYARLMRKWRHRIEGVLAIGHATPAWLAARGMPAERIMPFAYFLPEPTIPTQPERSKEAPFRVLFVGQFIERKRINLLIDALARLDGHSLELVVVGAGPLEADLRQRAGARLGDRVTWLGQQPMHEMPAIMAGADCLVLPSRHDGWGAVVSEALMAGTPAICSDRCGAAGVVRASGVGGVFKAGEVAELAEKLSMVVQFGQVTPERRQSIRHWSKCLGADAGAKFLDDILVSRKRGEPRPAPPWHKIVIGT